MTKNRILIVDDEVDVLELIKYNLEKEGFVTECSATGSKVLELIRKFKPHVLLLDLMLPGANGLDICSAIRADREYKDLPIIIISAKGEETDIVTGLELGADDYVCKPFSPKVLIARVRVIFRKLKNQPDPELDKISYNTISIDLQKHTAFLQDQKLDLSVTEFRILETLIKQPGRVFTRRQLIQQVHGESYPVTERSIDVQITGLRKKLGALREQIDTIRGVGYRLKEEE